MMGIIKGLLEVPHYAHLIFHPFHQWSNLALLLIQIISAVLRCEYLLSTFFSENIYWSSLFNSLKTFSKTGAGIQNDAPLE